MGSTNSFKRGKDLANLMEDLKLQRQCSLNKMSVIKERLICKISAHFSFFIMKIPKHLKDATMGSLYDSGFFNAGDASFLESVSALEGSQVLSNLQSTIRECNFLKPTPRFDDISAISVSLKDEDKRKKPPTRVKLNFSSVKKSPYKTLTKSRVLTASSKKRKASLQSPVKPSYDIQFEDNPERAVEKVKVILDELTERRKQSMRKLALMKEKLLNDVLNHFNNIRKTTANLEKEFTDYRDRDDLERFWNTHCKL